MLPSSLGNNAQERVFPKEGSMNIDPWGMQVFWRVILSTFLLFLAMHFVWRVLERRRWGPIKIRSVTLDLPVIVPERVFTEPPQTGGGRK
jgi:hypothetical protein